MFGILVVRTLRMEQHQLSDCAIIAVDAFITTRMESAYAVTVQNPVMREGRVGGPGNRTLRVSVYFRFF
jgi:hypothetical protein